MSKIRDFFQSVLGTKPNWVSFSDNENTYYIDKSNIVCITTTYMGDLYFIPEQVQVFVYLKNSSALELFLTSRQYSNFYDLFLRFPLADYAVARLVDKKSYNAWMAD